MSYIYIMNVSTINVAFFSFSLNHLFRNITNERNSAFLLELPGIYRKTEAKWDSQKNSLIIGWTITH